MQYRLNHRFIDDLAILGRHLTEVRRDQEENSVTTSSEHLLKDLKKIEQFHTLTILCKLHVVFNVNNEKCDRNDIRVNYEFLEMGGSEGELSENDGKGAGGLSFKDRVYRAYIVLFYARRLYGTMDFYFKCLAGSDVCNCMRRCDRAKCVATCEDPDCVRNCGRARCIRHCKSKERMRKLRRQRTTGIKGKV